MKIKLVVRFKSEYVRVRVTSVLGRILFKVSGTGFGGCYCRQEQKSRGPLIQGIQKTNCDTVSMK